MVYFLVVSRATWNPMVYFLRPSADAPLTRATALKVRHHYCVPSNLIYLVVVRAVCGERRAQVLEVLSLGLTLQRLHTRVVVPVGEEHTPIRGRELLGGRNAHLTAHF